MIHNTVINIINLLTSNKSDCVVTLKKIEHEHPYRAKILNKKTMNPLSQEAIYYSSRVMDKYSLSNKYFEVQDGRVREKTLGLKLKF